MEIKRRKAQAPMRRKDFIMGRLLLFGMLFAQFSSCPAEPCTSNTDCTGDHRICVEGACVEQESRNGTGSSPEEIVSRTDGVTAAGAPGPAAFWLNPVGLALFGPTAGIEVRVAPLWYLLVQYRYMALGPVYRAIEESDGDEVMMSTGAPGGGIRRFFPIGRGPHLAFAGGVFEWNFVNLEGEADIYHMDTGWWEYANYEVKSRGPTILANGGMRFRLGQKRRLLLTAGLYAGIFIETSWEMRDTDRNSLAQDTDSPEYERTVLPAIALDVSIGFGL
jgi:hypothetical protein